MRNVIYQSKFGLQTIEINSGKLGQQMNLLKEFRVAYKIDEKSRGWGEKNPKHPSRKRATENSVT